MQLNLSSGASAHFHSSQLSFLAHLGIWGPAAASAGASAPSFDWKTKNHKGSEEAWSSKTAPSTLSQLPSVALLAFGSKYALKQQCSTGKTFKIPSGVKSILQYPVLYHFCKAFFFNITSYLKFI